jgi:hypothetical protein
VSIDIVAAEGGDDKAENELQTNEPHADEGGESTDSDEEPAENLQIRKFAQGNDAEQASSESEGDPAETLKEHEERTEKLKGERSKLLKIYIEKRKYLEVEHNTKSTLTNRL